MRVVTRIVIVLAVLATAAVSAAASEKRITKSDLPPAVRKTADEQAKGAVVRRYSTDNEDGRLEYEVEMVSGGHSKDVSIAADGTVLEVEEQVSLSSLSSQVRSGLAAKAGKGRITKVESITKRGSIVAYEAQVLTGGKHSEIQVGPDGKSLDHEE
jgi:biopolymer transport protein ExbD